MTLDVSPPAGWELARGYPAVASGYDELRDEHGALRPHWRTLLAKLDALGLAELAKRWEKAEQLLHDNGVSYNVYGDPKGVDRPWSLSPLPVMLSARESERIESGVGQRARLLDALLADLYGPQRVLLDGLLPPSLVFANPGFLRPCHGVTPTTGSLLPLYAVDLVRRPDGSLCVVDDRTQTPSGMGYALENRIVVSSVLPEAIRECNVDRLAPFFRTLRECLQSLAPHNRDNPRIVVLTAGPHEPTYFEHAYLAQYLGYTLVDGGDLTVRGDRVLLKTLGGLHPVDVILRRVDDDHCDPLELLADSLSGVPGLLQAVRAGNVALANPLGSGLLQTPAMLGYLPACCRALLGEELILPSLRTLYCGDPASLQEAEAMFDDAVVRTTYPRRFFEPIATVHLSRSQRDELLDQVRAQPASYVVQERLQPSCAPELDGSSLAPRSLVMRMFSAASRHDHVVMPGGLARVARDGNSSSLQHGAISRDIWMLADGPVASTGAVSPNHRPVELSRGGSDLPSRAADNLFWLGRYAERAECVARLSRVLCARLRELPDPSELSRHSELSALARALGAQTALQYTAALEGLGAADIEAAVAEVSTAVLSESVPGSLRAAVASTLRTGRMVRDRISTDTWRVLAALDDELDAAAGDLGHDHHSVLHETLGRVILRLSAFSGLAMDSMTRGHAWRFLDMGRRVERAMSLVTLLRGTLITPTEREGPLLEAVLETADSAMTYRRRYMSTMQVAPVVDLLLVDETNPRAVLYQVDALWKSLGELPRPATGIRSAEERSALAILATLRLCEVPTLCTTAADGTRPALSSLLIGLATTIPALSDTLSARYLAHANLSRHLGYDESLAASEELLRGGTP